MSTSIPDLLSSGFNEVVGFEITHWQENEVELTLAVTDIHLNRSKILHGGVLATLLDVACGFSGCFCDTPGHVRRAVTLGLTTNFSASSDSRIVVTRATKMTGGKRIFFSRAETRDEAGVLLAMAQGDYSYMPGSEHINGTPLKG